MRLNRRAMLKGGAVAGAALAGPVLGGPVRAATAGGRHPMVLVFDSRIPESAAFVRGWDGSRGNAIDVAQAHADRWALLRGLEGAARVEGVTRWSDWVSVRAILLANGLRPTAEMRAPAPLSGRAHLFRWSMASR